MTRAPKKSFIPFQMMNLSFPRRGNDEFLTVLGGKRFLTPKTRVRIPLNTLGEAFLPIFTPSGLSSSSLSSFCLF
jgi:hypothetical protein